MAVIVPSVLDADLGAYAGAMAGATGHELLPSTGLDAHRTARLPGKQRSQGGRPGLILAAEARAKVGADDCDVRFGDLQSPG